jgi:hypothetical protein
MRLLTVGLLSLASACDGSVLALGAEDAAAAADAADDATPAAPESLACPAINETQYLALRGPTCAGACADALGATTAIASADQLAAALAGRWLFCGGGLGPADSVGVELDPGCIVYFLRTDSSGALVRGTDAAYQGTFDVVTQSIDVLGIALHLASGDARASVAVAGCPGRARLTLTAGGTVDLASTDVPEAGIPPGQ